MICAALLSSLLLFLLLLPAAAQAHLMEAQKGTVNIVGNGAFTVIALPVSAFKGVDDNGDGLLDGKELVAHRDTILAQIQTGLQLFDAKGPRPFEGVMVSLSPLHEGRSDRALHVVVMGRFALADPKGLHSLHVALFGTASNELAFGITASRGELAQDMQLTRRTPQANLLPTWTQSFQHWLTQTAKRFGAGPDNALLLALAGLMVVGAGAVRRSAG